jgi:S-(hydroxymethyl)glutathione dehydrogenase/alcohol dehydrogenase
MKTLAAVLVELKKPLQIMELEIPRLKKGQVLVQIAYSGVCHSQLNEWKGTKGADPYLPHTLGHEGSGIVLEIGEGVSKVKPGDSVVLSWIKGIGLDIPGTIYSAGNLNVNSGAISTFLQKGVISENRLIPIPSSISLKKAALLGCAIPTGAGVILNDMKVKEGQSVAIFGVGGIGSSALLAASHSKAYPIVGIDVHDIKLERAKKLGATHTINAEKEDVHERLKEIFGGKGADFALESAGKRKVMEMAFESIKPSSGHCILAGNLPKDEKIQIDPFDLIRGKKITGTWGGGSQIDQDVHRYIDIFIENRPDALEIMISDEVQLHEINQLMEALDRGAIARGLIAF